MKTNKLVFVALIAGIFHSQLAWAIDPRELLERSKGYFRQNQGPRGGGASPEEFAAREASQQALVDQKNDLTALSDEPIMLQASSDLTMAAVAPPKQVGWSGGSTYPTIYYDPVIKGRAYALSDSSGFYRSEDGGNTWQASNKGIHNLTISSLAVGQSDRNVLYAGSNSGIHRSTDGGKSWTYFANTSHITFRRLQSYRAIAVKPTDHWYAYAGSANGQVYVKPSGQTAWTQLGSLHAGVPVSAVHVARNGRVFAGSANGLFLWNESNRTWQKIALESGAGAFDIVSHYENNVETIFVTNGLKVARTTNTGTPTQWTYTAAMPRYDASSAGEASRLAVRRLSNGQFQIFVGQKRNWQGRVYMTTDSGATWRGLNSGFVNDPAVNPTRAWKKNAGVPVSVSFDPFDANTLYFSDDWGIWKSTDNGTTWRESIKGTPNTIGTALTYDARTGTYLVGTMDNGLVEVNPTTGAMKAVFPTASTPAYLQGHVWRVEALPNGNRVLTVSPWNAAQNYVVVITPDGRQTLAQGLPGWFPRQNTVWEKGYARGLTVDPKNPNRLFMAIDGDDGGGLFVSMDGGFNWTRTGNPSSRKIYNGLAIDPVEPNRLYWGTMWAGSAGGIFKSWDNGRTWHRVFSESPNIAQIVVAKNQTVYAAGQAPDGAPAVYVSRNKGVSFSLLKKFPGTGGPATGITIDPNNSRRMVVSQKIWNDFSGAKIWLTEDGGTNWTEVATETLPNNSGHIEARFADGGTLDVLLNNGTLYRVPLA